MQRLLAFTLLLTLSHGLYANTFECTDQQVDDYIVEMQKEITSFQSIITDLRDQKGQFAAVMKRAFNLNRYKRIKKPTGEILAQINAELAQIDFCNSQFKPMRDLINQKEQDLKDIQDRVNNKLEASNELYNMVLTCDRSLREFNRFKLSQLNYQVNALFHKAPTVAADQPLERLMREAKNNVKAYGRALKCIR